MVKFRLSAESSNGRVHHFLLIKMSEILFFILGCLVGWFINHWYSVNMRQPRLAQSGAGGGNDLFGSGYGHTSFTIHNELRQLGLRLPETVILGKPIKTSFGNQIVERDPARQCRARLLEPSGRHISHLWWIIDGKTISHTVDIKSGESASLILFLRSNRSSNQYFAYQPNSNTDPTPKTSGIPKFDNTMSFLVEVSYSHDSQKLEIPVNVVMGYDGNFSYKTPNTSGGF